MWSRVSAVYQIGAPGGEYNLLIQSLKANDLDAVTGISSRYHGPVVYCIDISARARTVWDIAHTAIYE